MAWRTPPSELNAWLAKRRQRDSAELGNVSRLARRRRLSARRRRASVPGTARPLSPAATPIKPRSPAPARSQQARLRGQLTAGIARVDGAVGLDEQHLRPVGGVRAVLDSSGDDEDLAGPKLDVAVAQMDGQAAAEHVEEVIGLVVLVPHERPLDLDDLQLVVVEVADDARLVGSVEQREAWPPG